MSKQSEAKKSQGYKMTSSISCRNCKRLQFDRSTTTWGGVEYHNDTNLRCIVGEFAVKKTGTCKLFLAKNDCKRSSGRKMDG